MKQRGHLPKGKAGKTGKMAAAQKNRRRIGLRLAAIFLVIVFLASECSTFLSLE